MLSYQEDIGAAAILSRAIAGVVNNKAVFSTPGSSGAVRLAMNKLILPELGHVVGELRKDL
jgi:molybdenum cofactor biosynthesis protein B